MRIAGLVLLALLAASAAGVAQSRHAAHFGQHGGMLLPVADDTLHVEGVFQEQRRFRVYVTEVTGEPVSFQRLRQVTARVVDSIRPELTIAPLVPSADGGYLEARIGSLTFPAVVTIVVRAGNTPEETFGLMYSDYSVEPPSFEVPPTVIPGTLPGVLAAVRAQVNEARQMIESGSFGTLYVPTAHIRELLLALVPYADRLVPARKVVADAAITEALRASWLVHAAGDLGAPFQNRAGGEVLKELFNDLVRSFDTLVTPIP
jgi:hypothetical protein